MFRCATWSFFFLAATLSVFVINGGASAQSVKNKSVSSQKEAVITAAEKGKLEAYLKKTLSSELSVRTRANTKGSLEVYKGDEFVGVIFADVEDGEKSFMFSVAILKEDL